MPIFFVVWSFSFLISVLITPITIAVFRHFCWVEDPIRKQQKSGNATALYPVPRGGGIPIFFAILLSMLLFLTPNSRTLAVLFSAFFTLLVGLIDDLFDLSPRLRLFTNLLSALIIVASGVGIAYISNPFHLGQVIDLAHPQISFYLLGQTRTIWFISDLLALFWIVWCTNIVGMAAGIEGQLPGFVGISSFFIGILALRFASDPSQLPVIVLASALSGAFIGFLPYNYYPQKIMPGYSAKSLAGLLLSILAILAGAKVATLILVLFLPMLDAVFVVFRRIKSHQPFYIGDGQHFHHRLLQLGYSRRKIAIIYWICSLVAGLLALSLNSQQKLYTFLGLILLFIGSLLYLFARTHSSPNRSHSQ